MGLPDTYIEKINTGQITDATFDEIFASNYVEHLNTAQELVGPQSQRDLVGALSSAFSDAHIDTNLSFSSGEFSVVHWTFKGKHTGDFMGIPATGNDVSFSAISIWKVVDGKNVEEWEIQDTMTLMQQLGVVPTS